MKNFVRLSVVLLVVLLAGWQNSARASCDPSVPMPPNPLPANFDWTPLAQGWCSQLAQCGYNTAGCVADYMSVIQSGGVVSGGSGGEATTTQSATVQLACEDSDEYAAGQTSCATLTCGDMGTADMRRSDMRPSDMHSTDLATCYYRCPSGRCVVDPIDCPSCANGGLQCDMSTPHDAAIRTDLHASGL
jgi:hypothetical protein